MRETYDPGVYVMSEYAASTRIIGKWVKRLPGKWKAILGNFNDKIIKKSFCLLS
jgi:predicted oxidoreductase